MSIGQLDMGRWTFVERPGIGGGNRTSSFGLMLANNRREQVWRAHHNWSVISISEGTLAQGMSKELARGRVKGERERGRTGEEGDIPSIQKR